MKLHCYKSLILEVYITGKRLAGLDFIASIFPVPNGGSLRLVLHGNVILSERIAGVWCKQSNSLSRAMDFRQFAANFAFITKPLEYVLIEAMTKSCW